MDFHALPEAKQLKIIADEYNSNTPTKEIAAKLGISIGALYARIRKAQETGLITEPRSQSSQEGGGQPAQVSSAAIPSAKVRAKVVEEPRATVEDFISQLEEARQKAQTYQERMELLSQAAKIAQAVEELLGRGLARCWLCFTWRWQDDQKEQLVSRHREGIEAVFLEYGQAGGPPGQGALLARHHQGPGDWAAEIKRIPSLTSQYSTRRPRLTA